MKKIIFLFAMVFAVSMAMGQNISEVSQENDGHNATIEQNGDLNEANTDQRGYNDEIEVNQTGTNNDVDVLQGYNYYTSSAWNSRAYIDQTGEDNTTLVTQIMNVGSSRNISNIDQDGTNNYAEQDLKNNVRATIVQEGTDNQAYQALKSNYLLDKGTILQDGESNWAKQTQGSGNISGELEAVIQQIGADNEADINQFGRNLTATSVQDGDGNHYEVTCDVAVDALDFAELPAAGEFSQWQNGSGHLAELDILGDLNATAQYQDGVGHTSTINITGNSNQAATGQIGSVGGVATINISGNNNCVGVSQNGFVEVSE